MSKLESFKSEMVAGGSVVERDPDEATDPATAIIGIGAWIVLFVVLGILNIWFLVFVLGVAVSVFLHECGHYWTARRSGMKVTQFFMGFGPRIWSFHRNGIEYGVRAVPLGAFVRIIGMNNLDEVPEHDEAVTYRQQSYPKRLLVISAGSLMHMIIAIVLITGVYVGFGQLEESGRVVVAADVSASSPAGVAGIRNGDQIVSIDGQTLTRAEQMNPLLRSIAPGQTVEVVIVRDGAQRVLSATLEQRADTLVPAGYLGVMTDSSTRVRPVVARGGGRRDAGPGPRPRSVDRRSGEGHQPGQRRRSPVRHQRRPHHTTRHARRRDADQRRHRHLRRLGRRAAAAGDGQRLRRRVQHVPPAAARRRSRRDRDLRAHPLAARASATLPTSPSSCRSSRSRSPCSGSCS